MLFKSHQIYEMRTIAIDDLGVFQSVSQLICLSVCLSVTRSGCAKTAGRIDVLLAVKTTGNVRNIVLNVIVVMLVAMSEMCNYCYFMFQCSRSTAFMTIATSEEETRKRLADCVSVLTV